MNIIVISLGVIGFVILMLGFRRRIYEFMLDHGYDAQEARLAGWVLAFYPACSFFLGMMFYTHPVELFLGGVLCHFIFALVAYVLVNFTQPPDQK